MFTCCDESAGGRWWVYGAVWLPNNSELPRYEAEAVKLRQGTNCWGEFKWKKAGPQYLKTYKSFLRLTLGLLGLKFTTIIVDTQLFTSEDMKKYHRDGGEQLAYLKFMRLLLKERIRRFASPSNPDHVILYDKLSMDKKLVSDFRAILQRDMDEISSRKEFDVRIEHLSQANSEVLHLMQAADLLTGATCWAWEGAKGTGRKANARKKIRKQIEDWARYDLTHDKLPGGRYYSAWRWEPS